MFNCERFTDFIQAHVEKTDDNRVFYDKNKTKYFALEAGLNVPGVIASYSSFAEVDFGSLPSRFVLKCTSLSSKKGVYLLKRLDKYKYFELLRCSDFSIADIQSDLKGLGAENSDLIAEELIVGEQGDEKIPFDYKFYCFEGEVEFILQIDRNVSPESMCFFDGKFCPADELIVSSDYKLIQKGAHVKPKNFLLMLESARALSAVTNRPFVSVDMYTDGHSCYVGELTGGPGGPYYGAAFKLSESFDLLLGSKMISSYMKRGWEIPVISKLAPAYLKA